EHAETKVGGEDAPAKLVVAVQMQQSGREYPNDRSSRVRQHHAQTGLPEMPRHTQQRVSGGRCEVSPEDRDFQAMFPVPRPRSGQEWPEQRAESAGAEQQAHAEKGAAFGRYAVPADSEFFLSHHREQHPARSDDQDSELRKDRRAQTNMRP